MTAEELKQQQLILLKEILTTWFNQDELEDLSFDLGVDYGALGGQTKESNVRHLLMMMSRRGRLTQLLDFCDIKKPEIDWDIFTHLGTNDPVVRANVPVAPPAAPRNLGLYLGLFGALLVVLVVGGIGANFFLSRTAPPVLTPAPAVLDIPTRSVAELQEQITLEPTLVPTNVIITAIPADNAGAKEDRRDLENGDGDAQQTEITDNSGVAPTATPIPGDLPIRVDITDTYQGERLKTANVRSGPGVEFDIVAQFGPNTKVNVWAFAYNSTGTPWYLIDIGDDQLGWISGVLLELDNVEFDEIPPAATSPAQTPESTPEPTA